MGNPTIWYYPDPNGTIEEIDLIDVSDLEISTERFRTDAEKVTGGLTITDYGTRHAVRIVRARFAGLTEAGEDLRAELKTLENHLQRGGWCGFARDKDTAWAGFVKTGRGRGQTILTTHGNVFYNPAAVLASGDRVTLQSSNPDGLIEGPFRISSQVGDVITLAAPMRKTFPRPPILVRERDFLPVLRMRSDVVNTPIITTDQRLNYTLDLQLVEDVEALFMFSGYGGTLRDTAETSGARGRSFDQVIGNIRERGVLVGSTTLRRD
jgi:hypothetical protein